MSSFLSVTIIAALIALSNVAGYCLTQHYYTRRLVFILMGALYISLFVNLIFVLTKM